MALKTRQQIASEYGICVKTLKRLLLREGFQIPKGLVTPKTQKMILEILCMPKSSITFPKTPDNSQ